MNAPGIASASSTSFGDTIFKYPSTKPCGAALLSAMPATTKKAQAEISCFGNIDMTEKEMGGIDFCLSRPRANKGKKRSYGICSDQTPRPWVAAYSTCEPLTIVSPATSTAGRPVPATVQVKVPLASLRTPKSVAANRSPLVERTRAVTGRSPIGPVPPSRFTQVASWATGLYVTENTCPGVLGVSEL